MWRTSASSTQSRLLFRGIIAPASLKLQNPQPLGRVLEPLFRGIIAPASLKRAFRRSGVPDASRASLRLPIIRKTDRENDIRLT